MSRHWTHYVLLHLHYAAIDDTSHYLTSNPGDEHPWEHLTEVVRESEYSRTLCFHAVHPCGASFRWHIPVYATSLTDHQPEKVATIFSYLHLIPASRRSSVFSLALSILDDQRLRTEAEITDLTTRLSYFQNLIATCHHLITPASSAAEPERNA